MRQRITVLVGIVLLAACASSHDGEGDAGVDAGSPIDAPAIDAVSLPPDTALDAWAYDPDDIVALETAWRASCTRRLRCLPPSTLQRYAPTYCNVDRWPSIEAGIRSGEITVDRTAITACMAALAALPADCILREDVYTPATIASLADETQAERTCDAPFVGRGARCGDVYCSGDQFCPVDAGCVPRCAPLASAGEACGYVPCAVGLSCMDGRCQVQCDSLDCVARGFDGCDATAHCVRFPHVGDACDFHLPCVDSLCVGGSCVAATYGGYGEACGGSVGCLDPYQCGATGTCRAVADSGGSCFSSRDCPPDTYCHRDARAPWGTCTAEPLGSWCETSVAYSIYVLRQFVNTDTCPDGYDCVDAACGHRAVDGATCTDDAGCAYGSACIGAVCTAIVMPWDACDATHVCPPSMLCAAGRCTRHRGWAVGDECRDDGGCDQGHCLDGVCVWRLPGESCTANECPSCVDGICADYAGARGSVCSATSACAADTYCQSDIAGGARCCLFDP